MRIGKNVITRNAEQTKELAKKLLPELLKERIVALHGELGSGKTTFVQGVAEALGIKDRVNSPTFLIMRSYTVGDKKENGSMRKMYHIDLYRIENEKQIEDLGVREILEGPQNVVFIEWAERMGRLLPEERIDIHFEYVDANRREIALISNSELVSESKV